MAFNRTLLRELRLNKGLEKTQHLSTALYQQCQVDISPLTIENHEKGTHQPQVRIVEAYSKYFQVEPSRFFTDKPQPTVA